MELRFEPLGLEVEVVSAYAPDEFDATLPPNAPLSPAFSLAANYLAGGRLFEFLPPKPTLIEQFTAKYASGRLRTTGAVAAGVAVIILGLFLFQQFQLWRLRSQWSHIAKERHGIAGHPGPDPVFTIPGMMTRSGRWRSCGNSRSRSRKTGAVTAKTIEIRDSGTTVACSGNVADIRFAAGDAVEAGASCPASPTCT